VLPLVLRDLTPVGFALVLVGQEFALIGQSLAFIGQGLALVCEPVALIGGLFACGQGRAAAGWLGMPPEWLPPGEPCFQDPSFRARCRPGQRWTPEHRPDDLAAGQLHSARGGSLPRGKAPPDAG
jgi:hypothetical protein